MENVLVSDQEAMVAEGLSTSQASVSALYSSLEGLSKVVPDSLPPSFPLRHESQLHGADHSPSATSSPPPRPHCSLDVALFDVYDSPSPSSDIVYHHQSALMPALIGRAFSADLARSFAWEHTLEAYSDESDDNGNYSEGVDAYDGDEDTDADDHSEGEEGWEVSSPKHTSIPRGKPSSARNLQRTRTRSLTDEDLEELRGCMELGFGFDHEESSNLKNTLPALELYHAISRQYADLKSRGSPVSTLDGKELVRTSSADSNNGLLSDTWRVSSPGEHPSKVKMRLRHWAQVVACSIKQSY